MTKPLRVFISSTSEDLKRYRAAAAEVVRDAGWIADVMDHFPADPDPIVVMCQRRMSECDLFLLLQAFRRGGIPGVAQGGDGETSYTAFELRAADQISKPVLLFLADEDTWPGEFHEEESAARAWVKRFRNTVNRSGRFFGPEEGDLSQFKVLIREAITHHKARLLDGAPDAERQWWQQSDAWFALTERLRGDPQSGFRALVELTEHEDADWPRLIERLRTAGVSASVFWEGAWGAGAARDAEEVLRVVERTHQAFLAPAEMFRAVSYAVEEAMRRRPEVAARASKLCATLREAFRRETGGAHLPPLFRGDAFYLPDEPRLGFVEIPAGPFRMGSDKTKDRLAFDEEVWPARPAAGGFWPFPSTRPASGTGHPQQSPGTIDVPTFHLARYPVTVAQFRVFVEATGFKLDNDDGLKFEPERPFVVVTWNEALEYCRWLERTLGESDATPDTLKRLLASGHHVGLPSEAEWEKAARGSDGRIYPWGDTIDPSRANYIDTRLERTSPVGAFPTGASPYGILDMSGNVWEWTRSLSKRYPYGPADGREGLTAKAARVVRGGSFSNPHPNVRAAYRLNLVPDNRYYNLGFRVVVSRSS